jgi:hypothetical protein
MRAVVFGSNSRGACIQHASSPSAAIERGCSIGANHAQNRQLTRSDLKARVAIARFRIIRAGFNKRSAQAFSKSDHRSDYPRRAAPWFEYRRGPLRLLGSGRLAYGEAPMKTPSLWIIAAACFMAPAAAAQARSAYDGSWDLAFMTQQGSCDPSYNFTVNISDGIVTHPNLVRFKGYVARSGSVRASVTVQDKFASGTGRLFGTSGRGKWSGRAGSALCSGYWTAQRN